MCNFAHISQNLSTQLVHRKMKTWIQILLLIVGMTLGHHTTCKAVPSVHGYQKETHKELSDVQQKLSDKYQLYHETLSDQERGTALLTDSNQSTRINAPRPQRYLPPTFNIPSSVHIRNPLKRGITSCTYGGKVTKIHIQLLPLHQESQSIIT